MTSLGDFDRANLDVLWLALLRKNGEVQSTFNSNHPNYPNEPGTVWLYRASERGGTDTPEDGEVEIDHYLDPTNAGADRTRITGVRLSRTVHPNLVMIINDNDLPQPLQLRDFFEEDGAGADVDLYVQVGSQVESINIVDMVDTIGGGFINVLLTEAMWDLLWDLEDDGLFIFAGARWRPNQPPAGTSSGNITLNVQFELDGRNMGWTTRTDHLMQADEVKLKRGFKSGDHNDCVACTGLAEFTLRNAKTESEGRPYSPGDTAAEGFDIDTGVRFCLDLGDGENQRILWTGHVIEIAETVGPNQPHFVYVKAADYLDRMARMGPPSIELGEDAPETILHAVETLGQNVEVEPRAILIQP